MAGMPFTCAFPSDEDRVLLTMALEALTEELVLVEATGCASLVEVVALLEVDLSVRCMSV